MFAKPIVCAKPTQARSVQAQASKVSPAAAGILAAVVAGQMMVAEPAKVCLGTRTRRAAPNRTKQTRLCRVIPLDPFVLGAEMT